ncbi:probable calcium-binding protein CML41 [Triticum dicoccoides]|uniref:probable calcium-binding protein CML41 n=1 Tax=Triticum dicoccoides TaxID=85692 RepID=UPI001890523E|nr:probable calcium-binding protein CML41 [Triticum dicoccoides]
MASMEVAKPGSSKRLSPKGSFRLSLLACGQCKATTVSPPGSPTGAGARSLSSSASSSAGTSRSRGRERDRQAELREIFRHFDRDMDGRISGRELGEFFASMGDGGAKAAMELDAASSGGGGDLMLGFEDFVRIVERKGGEEEEREDLRRAFEAFEAVKGSGRITPRGLQRVLSQLGDDPSVAECEVMIRAYDDDGDGELDFHDFHRMMSHD